MNLKDFLAYTWRSNNWFVRSIMLVAALGAILFGTVFLIGLGVFIFNAPLAFNLVVFLLITVFFWLWAADKYDRNRY